MVVGGITYAYNQKYIVMHFFYNENTLESVLSIIDNNNLVHRLVP